MRVTAALLAVLLVTPLLAARSSQSRAAAPGDTLTIYASMPVHGPSGVQGKAIQNGAQLALDDAGGAVAGHPIRYVRLGDSLPSVGASDEGKAAANARRAMKDRTTIGYIGQYNSGTSKVTIPMLNKAGIAQVSPTNTYVGLTVRAPGAAPGEPAKYYPAGRRTYARVVPNDTVQARALAVAARDAGCKSIHIWDTHTRYSRGMSTTAAARARKLGLQVEARRSIRPRAPNYRRLARRIHADCFVFTGEIELNGVQAVRDAAGAPSVKSLFAGDAMCLNDTARPRHGLPAGVAARFRCTISSLAPSAYPESSRRIFDAYARKFGKQAPVEALYGYESMSLLLDAINRAATQGPVNRRAVVRQLFLTRDRQSPLGTYSIDRHGDTTITNYGLFRIESGRLAFDRAVNAAAR